MHALPPALAPLASRAQFVCWFASPHPDKPNKFNKFPCRADAGAVIDAQDPANWTDVNTALAAHQLWDRGHGSGVGYVFTENDDFFFLDIDGAYEPHEDPTQPGEWSALAVELLARLPGAAVEVSHSGKGLHVFGRYSRPLTHANKNTPLGLELYTARRFVALTGTHARGDAATDCTASLELIAAQYFVPSATGDAVDWTSEPVAEWVGPADDDDLIERAMRSGMKSAAAVFGDGDAVLFKDLWEANAEKLAKRWPGEGHKPFGQSEADQALADHLAYWTGKNCERMERLMRRSGLAREKWDAHRTYLARTITQACRFTRNVINLTPKSDTPSAPLPTAAPEEMQAAVASAGRVLRSQAEYMGALEQLAHFSDCVYVAATETIYSISRGVELSKGSFDVLYGGYLFVIDPMGQAKPVASAWDAFRLSRVYAPIVADDMCFRPELPPGAIVTEGGRRLVNAYLPHPCVTAQGDPEPFLTHLAKLLPNPEDRRILLNYMASLAQNPGAKFQWWPVIQGAEQNGKTILLEVLTYLVGERYTHLPNPAAMVKNGLQFNSWINRKLFIGIEEIHVGAKRDFLEEFKTVVTNKRIPLEGKGSNQTNGDNRANGIMITNHKAGVPVTADQTRYAVFFTAQQRPEDLIRDGLDHAYFTRLRTWLDKQGGMAIVAGYLKTFPLEEAYDPARGRRAPKTSSSGEAVQHSLGRAEQEVLEAIEEGRPGFAGGWVSSIFLDRLLEGMRLPIPRNARRDMMRALGYDWHPALKDGRVNNTVTPDAGKPKLYLRAGHLALNLTTANEVAAAYTKAQQPGVDHAAAVFSLTAPST